MITTSCRRGPSRAWTWKGAVRLLWTLLLVASISDVRLWAAPLQAAAPAAHIPGADTPSEEADRDSTAGGAQDASEGAAASESQKSLVELAREERERKEQTRSSRVYTNEGVILVPSGATADAGDAGAPAARTRRQAVRTRLTASDSTPAPAPSPATPTPADPGTGRLADDLLAEILGRIPLVEAGEDQTITLPQTASLDGLLTRLGLPSLWTRLSGPGMVAFSDPTDLVTTASFRVPGTYRLRLSITDGRVTSSDEVVIEVLPDPADMRAAAPTAVPRIDPPSRPSKPPPPSSPPPAPATAPPPAPVSAGVPETIGEPPIEINGEVFNFDQPAGVTGSSSTIEGAILSQITAETTAPADTVTSPVEPVNAPPVVSAGEARTLVVLDESELPITATLKGTASDDGLGGPLTVRWWQVSGPASVGFGTPESVETTATFHETGIYLLRLRASDTAATSDSDVLVAVLMNAAPVVDAGPDQTIALPSSADLTGFVNDDLYPESGGVSAVWSLARGPGNVTFADPSQPATTASFSDAGTYVLRLTATDTVRTASDEVTIQVDEDASDGTLSVSIARVERDLPNPADPTPERIVAGRVTVLAEADGAQSVRFEACEGGGKTCYAIGGQDTTAPYSVIWDTTSLANGDYGLRAVGRRSDGTTVISHLFPVTISQFFVAPAGEATGSGTIDSPWTPAHALAQPDTVVPPGATVWFRGGGPAAPSVYTADAAGPGFFDSALSGSAAAPIKVRPFPGESVMLDGSLRPSGATELRPTLAVGGQHTWFMGFEITSTSEEARRSAGNYTTGPTDLRRPGGADLVGEGTRLINNVIHDTGNGIWISAAGGGKEAYGNVVYNNGWMYQDGSGQGNGVYAQNSGLPNLVEANLIGPQFGSGGQFHSGGGDVVNDYTIRGNAWIDADRLLVGSAGGTQLKLSGNSVVDNFFYKSDLQLGYEVLGDGTDVIGPEPAKRDVTATGNYVGLAPIIVRFWDTAIVTGNTSVISGDYHLDLWDPVTTGTVNNNAYYRGGAFRYWPVNGPAREYSNIAEWTVDTGHDRDSSYNLGQPPNYVQVLPNAYDPRLANIVIYNWFLEPVIGVDVSGLDLAAGDRYELRNAVDYYADVVTGTYDGGGTIWVPMTGHTIASPRGQTEPLRETPLPEFGAFRLIRTSR